MHGPLQLIGVILVGGLDHVNCQNIDADPAGLEEENTLDSCKATVKGYTLIGMSRVTGKACDTYNHGMALSTSSFEVVTMLVHVVCKCVSV